MVNELDSRTIGSLRFPLAVMVVAIHSYISIDGWSYSDIANMGVGANVAQFFMIAIGHVLSHIAVPTFFLISAYLLFNNFVDGDVTVWKRKLSSRLKSLVVPYDIWIVLYVIWLTLLGYKTVLDCGLIEWIHAHGGLKMFWCSKTWNLERVDLWGNPATASAPILVPLWFLRDLIVCVFLFSPIFFVLFKRRNSKAPLIIGLVLLSFLYFTQTSLYLPGFSPHTLFYFGIGSAMALQDTSITELFSKHKYLIWGLFIVLFVVEVALDGHNSVVGNIIYPFYVLVGVVFVVNIFSINKLNFFRGQKYTFFIFAFHFFVLPLVGMAIIRMMKLVTGCADVNSVRFANEFPVFVIVEYCLKIGLTVLLCMGIYALLNRWLPKLTNFLCGR